MNHYNLVNNLISYKSKGSQRALRGHGFPESILCHGLPLPDQCNKLTRATRKCLQLPLTLSPPKPCWFHRCSIAATCPAKTNRSGGRDPNS